MPRNATPSRDTLPPNQEKALAALLAGKTVTDAATAAEVDRTTLHRWLKDHAFQAALNRGRLDLRAAILTRLMNLAEKAVETVERSVGEGDEKTALALLKGLGLLSGTLPAVGSDDPQDLAAAAARNSMFRSIN